MSFWNSSLAITLRGVVRRLGLVPKFHLAQSGGLAPSLSADVSGRV
jgi:hypothetical protein